MHNSIRTIDMIIRIIRMFGVLLCLSAPLTHGAVPGEGPKVQPALYEIYNNDPYALKVIHGWLREYRCSVGSVVYKGDREAISWLCKQKEQNPSKVFQIGLDVLRQGADLDHKEFMIRLLSAPENPDKAPLIEEIHKQLQQLRQLPREEDGSITKYGLRFVISSAIILSKYGVESDRQILMDLSRDCPDDIKIKISKEVQKLDERLAKGNANPRPPKGRVGHAGSSSSSGRPENGDSQSAGVEPSSASRWAWIIGGGLLLLGGGLLLAHRLAARRKMK